MWSAIVEWEISEDVPPCDGDVLPVKLSCVMCGHDELHGEKDEHGNIDILVCPKCRMMWMGKESCLGVLRQHVMEVSWDK